MCCNRNFTESNKVMSFATILISKKKNNNNTFNQLKQVTK